LALSSIDISMRLSEALQIIGQPAGERQRNVQLVCGFEPLHLATFFKAHLRLRFPGDAVSVQTGLYGDLEGNIQRAAQTNLEGALAVIEWSDLDQRLGFRSSSGWRAQTIDDIAAQAEEKCSRLETHLATLADCMPVAVAGPTLGLPPLSYLPPAQASTFEIRLNALLSGFIQRLSERGRIKVLNASTLAVSSPPSARHDVKLDLLAGFPYTLTHTNTLAQLSTSCLFPASPKKGLITDLDQTLWKGILGDAGVDGVSWSLEGKSQAHALYQQLLASLAESGVLIAIASKNDPKIVETALQRSDILIQPTQIFPVEASWGAKSDAIARILKAWNVGEDSVVFVDDSPMELAEVSEKYPGIECLPFPTTDPAAIVALLQLLRSRFGKHEVREEDRLRLDSLRAAAEFDKQGPTEASSDFLSRLEAQVTFEATGAEEARALELVNKTNQFNLNGLRYTEAEWKTLQNRPGAFLTTVSYKDRFGPLGRIAVLSGYKEDGHCTVDIWVMSCRAFSRHIEFQALRHLFAKSKAAEVRFLFKPTERNGPLQTFFGHFFLPEALCNGDLNLSAGVFEKSCPTLFQEVVENG
jgi:FkbH-like protein